MPGGGARDGSAQGGEPHGRRDPGGDPGAAGGDAGTSSGGGSPARGGGAEAAVPGQPGPGGADAGARSGGGAPGLRAHVGSLPWATLVLGWIAAYLLGLAFGVALIQAGWWEQGAAWERAALVAANRTVSPALDVIFLWMPLVGTNYSLAPLVAVAAVLLWRRGRPWVAAHLAVVQLGSWLLNPLLKFSIPRPRPDLFELRGQFALPAYPSGHSIAVVSVLFTAAYLWHRAGHGAWIYWAWAAFFLLNSYSRIYLAVHWPTDVIGGVLVGGVWLAVTLRAFAGRHGPGRGRLFGRSEESGFS